MDVRKVLVVSANLGGFEQPLKHVKQSVDCDYYTYTDKNFPPRINSMTPRLQARIPKMTAWQMKPGYDFYLWIDSSYVFSDKDAVKYFLDGLGKSDIAVVKHPNRKTIQEEADYIQERLDKECKYITPRYKNERLKDQMAVVDPEADLYASTFFIYKNDTPAHDALTIWWLHTSLYHSIDQLSLPAAIDHSNARFRVLEYPKKYVTYTRR